MSSRRGRNRLLVAVAIVGGMLVGFGLPIRAQESAADPNSLACPAGDLVYEMIAELGPDHQPGGSGNPEDAAGDYLARVYPKLPPQEFQRVQSAATRARVEVGDAQQRQMIFEAVVNGDAWEIEYFTACNSTLVRGKGL